MGRVRPLEIQNIPSLIKPYPFFISSKPLLVFFHNYFFIVSFTDVLC